MIQDVVKKPEISFWMALILPILGFAVAWGVFSNRLDSLEERFNYFGGRFQEHEITADAQFHLVDGQFTFIQVTLAEIQKDILFIKESLK